jgi:hypothetical protein
MTTPHPKLAPLLAKHNVTHADFIKKGRPVKGTGEALVSARRAIITELHAQGTSWSEMLEVTGLGQGSIQRLTGAMWNPESRKRVSENGARTGKSWKGKPRPGQLERQWAAGTFDFHRGRVLSEAERQALRDGWTPERREASRQHSLRNWSNPDVQSKIMAFHTSHEERSRRSATQAQRMKDTPDVYVRGRAEWVDTPKGLHERAYVRSSYEKAAVTLLESDPDVVRYEHERTLSLPDGRWFLPDFIVERSNAKVVLVEVKAAWVLTHPRCGGERQRLAVSESFAKEQGWEFAVWTERELGC